jgi:hypothetical protein
LIQHCIFKSIFLCYFIFNYFIDRYVSGSQVIQAGNQSSVVEPLEGDNTALILGLVLGLVGLGEAGLGRRGPLRPA